ncbi:MAG: PH domain-containing protein [Dehalococcoidia bacterium]
MFYQPSRGLGLLVGTLLTLWSAGVAYVLYAFAANSGVGVEAFLGYAAAAALAGLTVLFAFWTNALASMSYAIDRNGLLITWGPTRQVVPLGAIERLVPGTAVGVPGVRGISWLGHHVGRAEIERIGAVMFYSTHQSAEQVLYVMTAERNYAISVDDPHAFAREIQIRQELGSTTEVSHHVERTGAAAQSFWEDASAREVAFSALLLCLGLWAYVLARFPSLPATLDLAFPPGARGELIAVSSREALLTLPQMATGLLLVNLVIGVFVHAQSRVGAYVLFATGALAQIAMAVAVTLALW